MKRFLCSCSGFGLMVLSSVALGATIVPAPVLYPADLWEGRSQAVVRVLDRLDQHVETLTIPVGTTATFKSIDITAKSCLTRPTTLAQDAAVQLDIKDKNPDGAVFNGWMLAAYPSLNVFESPVYDVRVVNCTGDSVAPTVAPLVNASAVSAVAPIDASAPASANTTGNAPTPGAALPSQGSAETPQSPASPVSAPAKNVAPAPVPLTPQDVPPPATRPPPPPLPSQAPVQLAPPVPLTPPMPVQSGNDQPVQLAPPSPYVQQR